MDYFSELLDSFGKLKKRTYKLTYINEADDKKQEAPGPGDPKTVEAAKQLVLGAMSAAKPGEDASDGTPINDTTGKPSTVKTWTKTLKNKTADQVIYLFFAMPGKGSRPQAHKASVNGTNNDQIIDAAAQVLATGEGKPSSEDQGAIDSEAAKAQAMKQAQDQIKKERQTIDGVIKTNGRDDMKKTSSILNRLMRSMEKFKLNPRRSDKGRLGGVRVGDRVRRMADKLSTGQMLEVDPKTGKAIMAPMDSNTAAEVSTNLERFFSILGVKPNDKNKICDNAKDKIAIYKGNMVVMDAEGQNGIVVTSNKYIPKEITSAMELYEDECGIKREDFEKLGSDSVATNTLNAVKGTFFETMAEALVLAMAGKSKEAAKLLQDAVNENREILNELAGKFDPNSGQSLEEFFEQQIQLELKNIIDNGLVGGYVKRNMALLAGIVGVAKADGVFRSSKSSTTGGREDIYFTFNDCAKAEAFAKKVGSDVRKSSEMEGADGDCAVGIGLKFTENDGSVKGGEIGSIGRMLSMFVDGLMDKDIEPGFYDKIFDILYEGVENGMERLEAARSLASEIEGSVATLTTFLHGPRQYVDSETGEVKSISPNETMEMVQVQISEILGPEALQSAPLRDMLYDVDAQGNLTAKDLTGDDQESEKARRRIGEVMGRMLRWKKYGEALEDPATKEAASDALKYQACISGANAREMAQMKAAMTGSVTVFSQNEALRNSFKGEVKVSGFGCNFVGEDGSEVRFGQERASTKDGAATRSVSYIKPSAQKNSKAEGNYDGIKVDEDPEKVEDDILRIFLKGQMELLEGLLNQTKD